MPSKWLRQTSFLFFYDSLNTMDNLDPLQSFWENLLSRNPTRIQSAFLSLDPTSKQVVIAHLQKMATDPGWHPEQVESARAALETIQSLFRKP